MAECLSPNFMVLCKHVSVNVTVQPEIFDGQDASSRSEAWWKSACEHVRGTERHLV